MYTGLFNDFLISDFTLQVYADVKLLFASDKDGLLSLLEYIDRFSPGRRRVTIFDKITGNAAALLSVRAGCREIYSPLGSQPAITTLDRYGTGYHFSQVVPHIRKPGGEDICPMEKLSLNKSPEEFYRAVRNIVAVNRKRSNGDPG